jgi:hypothetical protein
VGNPRSSKRNLEKSRQEKSAAKRDRRQGRPVEGQVDVPDEGAEDAAPPLTEEQALAGLAALHEAFASGAMSFERFEEEKESLMARFHVR